MFLQGKHVYLQEVLTIFNTAWYKKNLLFDLFKWYDILSKDTNGSTQSKICRYLQAITPRHSIGKNQFNVLHFTLATLVCRHLHGNFIWVLECTNISRLSFRLLFIAVLFSDTSLLLIRSIEKLHSLFLIYL